MGKTSSSLGSLGRSLKKKLQQGLLTPESQRILFIVGCQRSGTTLLNEIFERDSRSKVYGEFSEICVAKPGARPLSRGDKKYTSRLLAYERVSAVFVSSRAEFIVTKPLVESQYTDRLLDAFHGSKALWVYRDYVDVASSMIIKFGDVNGGEKNLRAIAKGESHWSSERLSEELRELVRRHYSEEMNPYDAAALFWYLRNKLYFDLGLEGDSRVCLCKYEDLVSSPGSEMRSIYNFCKVPYPGDGVIASVHSQSVKKGQGIRLTKNVQDLCDNMIDRLNNVYVSNRVPGADS